MNKVFRWGLYLVGGLLIILAVLLASLSVISNYVITNQLQKNGYTQSSIGELDIRLFDSAIVISDMQALSTNNLGLSFDRLVLDFSWQGVLNNQILVESFSTEKLQVRAQRRADGSFDLGLQMPPSAKATPEPTSPAEPWQVLLNELSLGQTQLSLVDENAEPLANLNFDLALQSLALSSSSKLSLERMQLRELDLTVQQQPVLAFKKLTAEKFSLPLSDETTESKESSAIVLEKLALESLTAALTLDAEGKPQLLSALTTESEAQSQSQTKESTDAPSAEHAHSGPTATTAASPTMPWQLGGFNLSGNNNIRFVDNSVAPPVDINLGISELSIGALDSLHPEQTTPASLTASLSEYNIINLSGTLTPLQASPDVDMKTSIEHLDISAFSPYVSALIGYKAKNGLLYLDSNLKIQNQQIESSNTLRLNKFNVAKDNEKKADEISAEISLPLDTALNLVRDKNDDIELELPIAGSLDSPEFSVGKIVNKTIAKALKGASLSYLKYAIQPWGAVWMVGEKLTEQAQTIAFDPVSFEAGQPLLDDAGQKYLQTLGTLLADKPFLRLTLCPITNASDSASLNAVENTNTELTETELANQLKTQLDSLGKKRAAAVKQFLVEQQAVTPDRLFSCAPHHDNSAKQPVVKIAM